MNATGSFAEESQRLLAAFQEWAARGRMAAKDLAAQGDPETAGAAHPQHGPECAFCPICQGIALLRGARPEVVDHLTDAMTSLAAALSALLAPEPDQAQRRTQDAVQHIDVSGDDAADTGS